MEKTNTKFLMLGESVVDFISSGYVTSLEEASSFEIYAGGEVANLAVNLSRMGFCVWLGSCLGTDGLGKFHKRAMEGAGLDLSLLQSTATAPTTIIPVARQTGTPDFVVYRGADAQLQPSDELAAAAAQANAIHTSAFALSRDPCRTTIKSLIENLSDPAPILSIDPNFHPAIGPDIPDYLPFLKDFMGYATIVKPSLDDSIRIFGPGRKPADYLDLFLDLGPKMVVLTLGGEGSLLGTSSGDRFHIHPRPVPVVDVTGAGDAYWSGLLAGLVTGSSPLNAARLGQAVAEHKIGFVGPIQDHHPLPAYRESAQDLDYSTIE